MSRLTIKELQGKLDISNNIIKMWDAEISNLTKELESTRNELNVVSSSEFNAILNRR